MVAAAGQAPGGQGVANPDNGGSDGFGMFNPKLLEAQVKEDVLTERAALQAASQARSAPMATSAVPLLNDETVNLQPDVNSGGLSFADSLEQSALNDINVLGSVATRNVASGRMPFDPNSPLVGTLQNPGSIAGSSGLLIIILLLVLVLK